MYDLLETIIHLKTVPHALLRISATDNSLKGRVGFGPGGYILGGYLDDTNEIGYSAIKKLLTIKSGNYAVLDTGLEHSSEVNQTLWIKGEKILEVWPNLPDSPDKLLDVNGDLSNIVQDDTQTKFPADEKEQSISRVRFTAIEIDKKKPYGYKKELAIILSSTILILLILLFLILFGNKIMETPTKTQPNATKGW